MRLDQPSESHVKLRHSTRRNSQEKPEEFGETHVEVDVLERLGKSALPDVDSDPESQEDGHSQVSKEESLGSLHRVGISSADGPNSLEKESEVSFALRVSYRSQREA